TELGQQYGRTSWSPLDWLVEGAAPSNGRDVRAVLVGGVGVTGGFDMFKRARSDEAWSEAPTWAAAIAALKAGPRLGSSTPIDVVVWTHPNVCQGPVIDNDDVAAVIRFVNGGGRVAVLDDCGWAVPL